MEIALTPKEKNLTSDRNSLDVFDNISRLRSDFEENQEFINFYNSENKLLDKENDCSFYRALKVFLKKNEL